MSRRKSLLKKLSQAEREIEEFNRSQWTEWRNLTDDNNALWHDVGNLQAEYGLPVNSQEAASVWNGSTPYDVDKIKRANEYEAKIRQLLVKHSIPAYFEGALNHMALFGKILNEKIGKNAFVEVHIGLTWGKDGGIWESSHREWKVTTDTLISNELVKFYMEQGHKLDAMKFAPRPTVNQSDKRKRDWEQVHLWFIQHPSITYKDYAKATGINERIIRNAMSRLGGRKKL